MRTSERVGVWLLAGLHPSSSSLLPRTPSGANAWPSGGMNCILLLFPLIPSVPSPLCLPLCLSSILCRLLSMTQPPTSYFACPASVPSSSSSSSSCSFSAPPPHQSLPSPTSPALPALDIPPASTSLSIMDHTPVSTAATNSNSISSSNLMFNSTLSPTTSLKEHRSPSPLPLPHSFSSPDLHTSTTIPARVTRSGVQRLQQNSTPVASSSMTPSLTSPSHLAVADISLTDCNGTTGRSRTPSSTSASTPPPSPPLVATPSSSSPSPSTQLQSVSRRMSDQLPRVHSPVSAAAAAAAAASYTSQELAIAYSMVTSTRQDQAPEVENDDNLGTKARSPALPSSPEQQAAPVETSDALSSLWKAAPPQEPYFRTRHTIASQHTLSTLGGALFSLDEDQKEFTTDMYIAMRNRIFELEAKTVNYAPFNRTSLKRPADRLAPLEDHYHHEPHSSTHDHLADMDLSRPSKRPAYHHISHHHSPHPEYPHYIGAASSGSMRTGTRQAMAYPSWYSPETYFNYHRSQYPSHTVRYPQTIEREREQRQRAFKAQNPMANMLMDPEGHVGGNSASTASVGQSPPKVRRPSIAPAQPPAIQPRPILPNGEAPLQPSVNRTSPPSYPHRQLAMVDSVESAAAAAAQQRQSFHQRQHRAQQQAQSDYSRSYHLQKHMRMMDQRRAALLAQQQQQQLQQQQQQQQNHQSPVLKPIQRHYQPHQQMYSSSSTKPTSIQPSSLQSISHKQQHQQRLLQYQQQRQLLLQQQQARQLQYLRQRGMPGNRSTSTGIGSPKPNASPTSSLKVSSPGPSSATESASTLKKKQKRPIECFNCMALDSLTWRPRTSDSLTSSTSASDGGSPTPSLSSGLASVEGRYLCTACLQYMQAHGHCRPVPSFSVNFLKKIHCLFKKELQVVRFQGWQDAQVLEIEDHMTAEDFQLLSVGMGGGSIVAEAPIGEEAKGDMPFGITTEEHEGRVVIKIEDSDDEDAPLTGKTGLRSQSLKKSREVIKSTFQSEAAVGDLFGHRWKTEPMVGYTLVHFGGTDRTRMVPMNPTVPSLTVTFQPESESITFTFRVLVNGLCLLSTGGGPPALHMPEMTDESDDSDQDENPPAEQSRSQVSESGLDVDDKTNGSALTNTSRESTTSRALESTVDRESVPPADEMDTSE